MTGILLIVLFIILALLMWRGKIPALLALPLLAFGVTMIAGTAHAQAAHAGNGLFAWGLGAKEAFQLFLTTVIGDGIPRLSNAIFTVILGGIFGYLLKLTGVSEKMVRKVAELSGDHPFLITLALTLIVSLLFTSLGGLGAIILVANIFFPVLLSLGVPPLLAGAIFLMALSFGGVFNMVNWAFYIDVLKLSQSAIMAYALPFGLIFLVFIIAFMVIEFKRAGLRVPLFPLIGVLVVLGALIAGGFWLNHIVPASAWAMFRLGLGLLLALSLGLAMLFRRFNSIALIAPFVPITLVMALGWPINAAFIAGMVYLVFATLHFTDETTLSTQTRLMVQSCLEGVQAVSAAVALMLGIGLVLIAVTQEPVKLALAPILTVILPGSKLTYVLFFGILAPLALYRGPMNIWGMGSGLLGLIQQISTLTPTAIMAAFLSTGQIQGVCDPTNTHNVWIANHLKIDLQALMTKTLPYIWVLAVCGLILGAYVG